jgi:hypothetical protein
MIKTTIIAVFMTATSLSAAASGSGCENISPQYPATSFTEEIPGAEELLKQILAVTGLRPNFELRQARVMNIEASISRRKRFILYNPEFISQINRMTRDKWATMALLAHEVGHHLNGHTIRNTGSTPELELEADEFAGFVLYKLGAPLDKAQEVMKYIAKEQASASHPGRNDRMLAIEKGWKRAAGA